MKHGKILWMVIGLILGMVLMGGNGVMAGSGDPVEADKPVPTIDQLSYTIPSNGVYDGKGHSATVTPNADAETGMGDITVKYFKAGSAEAMTTAPVDAGTYTVEVVSGISGAVTSPLKEVSGGVYQSTITPSSGDLSKGLPAAVTVSVQAGGTTVALKEGTDFTYNALTGDVTIEADKAIGPHTLTISGTCSDMTCGGTISGGSLNVSASPRYGIAYSGTIEPAPGQELPGAITVGANGVTLGASGPIPSSVTGAVAGTTGQCRRMEALRIWASGTAASQYAVQYRVHVQNRGWTDWVEDGAEAGTTGLGMRIEAVQVRVAEKE